MKKLFIYLISVLSIICMLVGLFFKIEILIAFGFYLHIVEATCIALTEYKISNKFAFKTIFYPIALGILTCIIVYQWTLG